MNYLAKKIKNLLELKGITHQSAAAELDWGTSTLTNLLNGNRELTEEKAEFVLVKVFDYKPSEAKDQVAQWVAEDSLHSLNDSSRAAMLQKFGQIQPLGGVVEVPVYGTASCGVPRNEQTLMENDDVEKIPLPGGMVEGFGDDIYILRADGNSMEPVLSNGSYVVIKPAFEYQGATKTYLLVIDNECVIGNLAMVEGLYRISKANKEYPPIPVEGHEVQICGVVVAEYKYH